MNKICLTLNKKSAFLSTLFATSMLISPVSNAGLMFFDDRAAFELASGLSGIHEDFESAKVEDWEVALTTNPLNALTNDDIFSTGDIAVGVNVSASTGGVVALGAGLFGDSKVVAADLFSASTILSFDVGVQAIGLDLFADAYLDIFDISLFGFNDGLLGITTASGLDFITSSFFGVISDDTLITKIDFNSQAGLGEGIDNIIYGNVVGAVDVPEPSIVFLLLTAMIALGASRKKSNNKQ